MGPETGREGHIFRQKWRERWQRQVYVHKHLLHCISKYQKCVVFPSAIHLLIQQLARANNMLETLQITRTSSM